MQSQRIGEVDHTRWSLLAAGSTLEEAFILMFRLQRACEIQVAAQAGGAELVIPDEATCRAAAEMVDRFLAGNEGYGVGKLEFDAWVRLIDGPAD